MCSDQKGWGVVNEDFEHDYQDLERMAEYSALAVVESQLLGDPIVKKLMHLAWIQGKKQQQRNGPPTIKEVLESNMELLSCPFCGGPAEEIRSEDDKERDYYQIRCVGDYCTVGPETFKDEDFPHVVQAWNTRRGQLFRGVE